MKLVIKRTFLQLLYIVVYISIAYIFWQIEQIIDFKNSSFSYIFTALGALAGFTTVRVMSKTKLKQSINGLSISSIVVAILTGVVLNCFIGTLFEVFIFHKDLELVHIEKI